MTILTTRLDLVPAAIDSVLAALRSPEALSKSIAAIVPNTWPPEFLDDAALRFMVDRLQKFPDEQIWWMYFVIFREVEGQRTLVGTAGFKGPPIDGTVEIGYGIVSEYQRRGFATETAQGLIDIAFGFPAINRVVAETYPELFKSIGVLTKCGFRLIGAGSEPNVIRYEKPRE